MNIDMTIALRIIMFVCILINAFGIYSTHRAKKAYEKARDEMAENLERLNQSQWNRLTKSMGTNNLEIIKVTPIRKENE
jgi:cell division protein FtsL